MVMLEAPQWQGGKMSEKYCPDKITYEYFCDQIVKSEAAGYAQALADAKAAVTAYWNEAYPGGVLELAKFIAAIEKLEVKP